MCDIWAHNIKKAIEIDPINVKSEYQIPTNNNTEEEILNTPTKFLRRSEYPNSLNSLTTLSYLKVQTKKTENATTNWNTTDNSNISPTLYQT